jgi:hypothetical protein
MRTVSRRWFLLLGVALMTTASLAADKAATMTYLHLYTDKDGVSRIKEERVPFTRARAGGPMIAQLAKTEGAAFLMLEAGAFEDWHPAPQRWFLIAVKGISEVTTSDGKVRRLTPGTLMLMDDTTGKGHQTRAVGPEDHVALVVPVQSVPGLE